MDEIVNASQKNIGLIPARGGSKGVPRKNIRVVKGKPLIAYTIQAALASRTLDRVIVSTDDEEIASIAVDCGAEVPFMRPVELAQDSSPDIEVVKHLISWCRKSGLEPNIIAYLRPTTPFKQADMIDTTVSQLSESTGLTSIRSVTAVEGVHHPYWMFKKERDRLYSFIDGISADTYYQRQRLPECFRLNGVVDVFRAENLDKYAGMYGPVIGKYEVDENSSLDIDTELDLKLFELLLGD